MNRRAFLAGALTAPVVAMLPEPVLHAGGYVEQSRLKVPHRGVISWTQADLLYVDRLARRFGTSPAVVMSWSASELTTALQALP